MFRFGHRTAVAVAAVAVSAAAAGAVVAATQPSDEAALQPARQPADPAIETRGNELLAEMTLQEKLQQISLLPDFKASDDVIRKGLGSVLSVTDPVQIRRMQR